MRMGKNQKARRCLEGFFHAYFADHQDSYAIKFKTVFKLETPKSLMCLGNNIAAPQSYTYLTETTEELCNKLGLK